MSTEKVGAEGATGTRTGPHFDGSHFQMPRTYSDPRGMGVKNVTRPHEHWCAVCGIGLGGDA